MAKHELVTQSSWRPTAKVAAVWATSAGAPIILAAIAAVSDAVDQQTFWGAAIVGAAASLAGWLKRARTSDA